MVSVVSLALAAVVLVVIYRWFTKEDEPKTGKRLPGPKGLPFLGSILSVTFTPHLKFSEWANKFGRVFRVKLANINFVVISDAKIAKEAFNNPLLNGRPDFKLFNLFSKGNYGIFNSHGEVWQEQRRFMLRSLRDFGFGKSTMQQQVMEEASDYVQWLKSEEGNSITLNRKFTLATINSLWQLISGKRFKQTDTQVSEFLDSSNNLSRAVEVMFAPGVAESMPRISGWNKLLKLVDENEAFVKAPVEEHQAEFSPENEPRDFIDAYLKQIEETKESESSFYKHKGEHSLKVVISDLFGAGSETTSLTLVWAILYLCKHPEMQKKMQDELDRVLGSRQPCLDDRKNLPYTEAVITETLRKSTITAVGVFHCALEDTTLDGYFIPKNSWVSINHYHVHHDPAIWGDPFKFRPDRWLSDDGKTINTKHDHLIPFSVGKRICVGEQIAKDSAFIFLTAIIQRFEIAFDPKKKEPDMEAKTPVFLSPDEFFVILKDRLK